MDLLRDECGFYTIGKDGVKNYASVRLLEREGELVFLFDQKTGTLYLSASPENCAVLTEVFEVTEGGEPKTIELPGQNQSGPKLFSIMGVTNIVALPPRPNGEYFLDVEH